MRLDLLLSKRENITRTRASNLIKTGGLTVNGKVITKAGFEVPDSADIQVLDTLKYESLGGVKLENALNYFNITDLTDLECLDIGAANGGFTDCLLKKGAKSVDAVDLHIAFSEDLARDSRVICHDNLNAKDICNIFGAEKFDLVVADVSFISLSHILSQIFYVLKNGGRAIVLFKPQFEVGKKFLPKSGIVRDDKAIKSAFDNLLAHISEIGYKYQGYCLVPALFASKNQERTLLLCK